MGMSLPESSSGGKGVFSQMSQPDVSNFARAMSSFARNTTGTVSASASACR